MVSSVYETAIEVLTPLVGRPAAEICARSTAVSVGTSAEELAPEHVSVLTERIRESMSPFTSRHMLEVAIVEIKRRTARAV